MDVQTITANNAEFQTTPTAETALIKQTGRTWYEWHKILGHISPAALLKLGSTELVDGMEIAESAEGLNFECKTCIQAKAHVQPFPKESKSKVKEIGELIVTDVWGLARTTSIGRYRYYVSFTDVATQYTHIAFLRHKDETIDEYKAFEALLHTQKGKKIKHVRFDNGGEFVNKQWIEHAKSKGTILETTSPYSSQQNGIAERLNRTLTEKARAMLIESGAPKFLWSEVIAYACYLKNRVPTQVRGKFWKTPFESFWDRKPNISILRPWGTKCYVLNQGENSSKLDSKTFTAIFTGISDVQGKSWQYYKSGANKILHSCNITFTQSAVFAKGNPNDPDWVETVTLPVEGEMTSQKDNAAEQLRESARTGGVKPEIKSEIMSPKITELKDIKAEEKLELKPVTTSTPTAVSTSQSKSKAPIIPTTTNRSRSTMPKSNATQSMLQLQNMGIDTSGIRTHRSNPNQPAIELDPKGGIKVKDSPISGQSHTPDSNEPTHPTKLAEFVNYYTEGNSDYDDNSDAYSLLTNSMSPPELPMPITPPSYTTLPLDSRPVTPNSYSNLVTLLEEKLAKLSIDDPKPIEPFRAPDEPSIEDRPEDFALAARFSPSNDNPTVEEALSGPNKKEWMAAMCEEVLNLVNLQTFELTKLPPGKNLIGCKWVLTIKRDEKGAISRYKARLVAQGFSQKPSQDYNETFAPVVRLDSIHSLVSVANHNDWDIRQLDVHAAYLHAEVEEELFMRQIPYFHLDDSSVLHLRRSIYGLKQAGHMWNRMFDSKLKTLGYTPTLSNACVYHRVLSIDNEVFISMITIHVNDSIVISTPNHTDFTIAELLKEFDMRDLGPIHHFLGIQFTRYRDHGMIILSQTAYIDSVIAFTGLQDAYPVDTPLSPSVRLTKHEGPRPNYPYAAMIGKVLWAALCTRPDIAFAATYLSQFTSCFGPTHVTQIKHLIRYLKGTLFLGLVYKRSSEGFGEIGYSDADWGSSSIDRKSISGYVFMLGGAAVAWSAKKQPTVALSTMEAEYIALSHACTQALWFRQFFEELRFPANAPTLLLSDNLAALTLSAESQFHGRAKHIDIRHHFIRDVIQKRQVTTLYAPSPDNLADAFTKALPAPQFNYLMNSIMGAPVFEDNDVEFVDVD